jgi:MHS family proline/betaine transporter-like MFS transporter
MVAANFGSLLGNLVGATLRSALSEEQLYNWGWRLPFFSGILIALVAWWLDKNGTEVHTTAGVYDQESSEIKNPLTLTFAKENRLALLSTALTPILWAGGFYLSFVWMAVYMGTLLNPPIPGAFWINAGSMLIGMTFMLPIAGSISDRVGRVKMMTIAAILLTAGGPLLLIMISKGDAITAFLCQVTIGIFLSFYGGSLCAWLVESFPAKVRLTSASLGYDLAHALVGGFSPVMATQLFDRYGVTSPGWLYVIFGSLSLLGLYINYFCGNGPGQEKGSEEDEKPEQELPEIA